MATNGTEQVTTADPRSDSATSSSANLSKDEVGWYFVEQYYTTLSTCPEKLHLFYSKRSQFVYGVEAEVTNVSIGRQEIQERIKKLNFQDCKVRVSNVDSQASFDNIVIQVIGEISNKSGEPKKFVQTFVLAQQPSGYFVLNDILRYINEDGEEAQQNQQEEQEEEQQQEEQQQERSAEVEAEVIVVKAEVATPEPAANEPEAAEPESAKSEAVEVVAVVEKTQDIPAAADVSEADVPSKAPETIESKIEEPAPVAVDIVVNESTVETTEETEKADEPTPIPAAKPDAPAPSAPVPAEPAAPPRPMTWASRAAAAAGPRPVVPLPKTATPPAYTQTRPPAPAPASAPASAPAPTAAAAPAAAAAAPSPASTEAPAKEASGWQTAGADSKRQNRPQPTSAIVTDKEGTMGYVKYVTEKVQEADLRNALEAHGALNYFDINRSKNCAFVEYKTLEAYQAAIASNPHVVNGENIVVEPRRPKSNTYGGGNYGSSRGGASGRGRGGFDGNRSGGQGNPRGNFSGQSRGRGGAARGRGGAQAVSS